MTRWFRSFRLRLWALLHRRQLEKDLDDELTYHLELTQENGARAPFGNRARVRAATRELWTFAGLERLCRDLHLGARSLGRTPAFTITVILTLAVAIGANSAVFSAVDAVLLRPLPYPESEQLVQLLEVDKEGGFARSTAPVRVEEWNELNDTFEAISGYFFETVAELSGELPEQLTWARVSPRFLDVMAVEPILGRGFTADEAVFNSPPVALISESLWRRRFDADMGAIGETLRFDEDTYTIVGVMPESFRFPTPEVDVWYQFQVAGAPYADSRALNWLTGVGRLRDGVSIDEARANMAAVQSSLGRAYPDPDAELAVQVDSLNRLAVGPDVGRLLWLLFSAVCVLLLIGCTNIAALLLSRAVRRQHEVAVRYSLGASRGAITTLRLAESAILSAAGGMLGLAFAAGGAAAFRALASDMPRASEIGLDLRLVAYTFACSAVVCLACGFLPALLSQRQAVVSSLAKGGRSQLSVRNPAQWTLVGLQVALAVTLLCGAGLLLRSFQELAQVRPGFDSSRVASLSISMSWAEALPGNDPVGDRIALGQWTDRMLAVLEAAPGIEAAAFSSEIPGRASEDLQTAELVGRNDETGPEILADAKNVSSSYFAALGIPLLSGELCTGESDGTYSSAVVNRVFAQTYVSDGTPIGRRLVPSPGVEVEIRGIVGDARENGLHREPVPTVYVCAGIAYPGTPFLVRTSGDPGAVATTLRTVIKDADPRRAVYAVRPLDRHLSDARAGERALAALFMAFGGSALLLSGMGVYGTLSYAVSARRREVGLRLAVGAQRRHVLRRFVGEGLRASLMGAFVGAAITLVAGRALEGMLYGVSSADAFTISTVVLIVIGVAATASLVPAVRAAGLDPVRALRDE